MSRRLISITICAAAALLVWIVLPGTAIDRGFFSLSARTFVKSNYFVSGKGTQGSLFTLHTLRSSPPDITANLPLDIVISDDLQNVFQSSPPSPVDFAVILKNLRRMGRDSVAIGMPLAWTEPDVISLAALDQQLDSFPAVVTSAPLSRNPLPSPIPPAFRRASVPLFSIEGDTALLPIVNRIPIPDVVLGNKTSLAGFTTLESEETTSQPHLLARWDDRAVLSFHLLTTLNHLDIQPHSITVRLGEWISLSTDGPFIPIDEYGRLNFQPPPPAQTGILAETLIDAPDDFLTGNPFAPVLIRNDLSASDSSAAEYSNSLVATVALLSHPEGTSVSRRFPRPPWYAELLLISSLLSLLYGFGNYPFLAGKRPLVILAGCLFVLHFILVPTTSTWIPTFPLIACALAAIPFATVTDPSKTKRPAAKKAATKKAVKNSARKTSSKKSPRKRKRR